VKIWLIDIPRPLENAVGSRLITGCKTVVVTEWVEWLLLAITSPTSPPQWPRREPGSIGSICACLVICLLTHKVWLSPGQPRGRVGIAG
jgi:hypothetical protein